MGNVCSCLTDADADTLAYKPKEVSKYAGTVAGRPQVVTDAQRSSHSSSPERRRGGARDGPSIAVEQQEAQLEEQAWRSPGAAAEHCEQEQALLHEPDTPSGVPFSWTKGELIGIGAFGRVFSALNNNTGELVAVKQVAFAKDEALQGRVAEHIRALEAEVEVLKTLKHENIVRYLGTEISDDTLHIFLEYVPGGSIASLLAKFGPFPESVIRVYTAQLLRGLQYLHQKGIMHRDIKGANILIDKHGTVKLADFGASKKIEDLATVGTGSKSIRGTPYWMAPEVIKQTGHGCPADIWSLGCTVIEMATGKPPWSDDNTVPLAAMFRIASSRDPPPLAENVLSTEGREFLTQCFERVANSRATATDLLKHPFVANVQLQRPLPFPGQSQSLHHANSGGSSSSSPSSAAGSSSSSRAQARHGQQQYTARQTVGPGPNGSRSNSSLRPPGSGSSAAQAAKAAEQARGSPGQTRCSPMRQAAEAAGSPAAASSASHTGQRNGDASGLIAAVRPSNPQQQQQQQQHYKQQEQLPIKQQQQTSQLTQQQQGSVSSSQEGLGLQQEGCMTLVEWNPMQEPSWAPPYQHQPAPAHSKSSRRQQQAGEGSTMEQQQPFQLVATAAAAVELQEVADAPRLPASSSRAQAAAAGTSTSTTSSSSSSNLAATAAAPGQLRHGSMSGPTNGSNSGSKRGIGSCSTAGPLSKGPAGRASSGFGLAAAAATAAAAGASPGTVPVASSVAAGSLLASMAAKSGKQLRQPGSSVLASACSVQAAAPAAAAAGDGGQAVGGMQDQCSGPGASGQLRLQDVDVAKSTKLAQWENELYEELERHRKEQRASRAAASRSLCATGPLRQ